MIETYLTKGRKFLERLWRSPAGFILLALAATYTIGMITDPDYLFFQRQSYTTEHDTEIPYEDTYMLISFFYHGGLQLWDRFDQMNIAFYHLTSGVFTVSNILQAIIYIILAPFVSHQGQLLHIIHTTGFFLINALIRTIGGYLLLRYLAIERWAIFIVIIYINTFFSTIFYNGFLTNNLYSYYLLTIFLILKFLERLQIRDFLLCVLAVTIAVANSPLFAVNYYYLALHMFIVPCVVYRIFNRRSGSLQAFIASWRRRDVWVKSALVVFSCALIILPDVILMKSVKEDFYIADSGVGATQGRMHTGFGPAKYFRSPFGVAGVETFPLKAIDFWHNDWWIGWPFLGLSTLLFSGLGLFFSRDRRRYIFLAAIILIILVNAPKDPKAWTSLGHWVNALTNPLHFLLRSFHMTGLLMPYLFAPLVAFGLQSTVKMWKNPKKDAMSKRYVVCVLGLMSLLPVAALVLEIPLRWYLIAGACAFLVFLTLLRAQSQGQLPAYVSASRWVKYVPAVLLAVFVGIDVGAFSYYVRHNNYSRGTYEPQKFTSLSGNATPLVLEFQNPRILPWRDNFRPDILDVDPPVYRNQNNYGLFYHFLPLGRYVYPPNLSRPMHISYKELHTDPIIHRYVNANPKVMFFADAAVDANRVSLGDLLAAGLQDQVVAVEPQDGVNKDLLTRLPVKNELKKKEKDIPTRVSRWEFDLMRARRKFHSKTVQLIFKLPKDFPAYFATDVFTDDWKMWTLSIAGQKLSPVQGSLVVPFTFDVRNIRSDELRILLPKHYSLLDRKATLEIQSNSLLLDIWKNQYDHFGFDYQAPQDGWLVLHYPYDTKWRLTIDGARAQFSKVNGYFMGVRLTEGKHKILMEYWPETPVRWMIILSTILVFAVLGTVLYLSFRDDVRAEKRILKV